MHNIALIGCGNIGRRHLQALALSEQDANIVIVEPNPQARDAAQEVLPINSPAHVTFTDTLAGMNPALSGPLDLAIIATAADVRKLVVTDLIRHAAPNTLLLEKVLLTSVKDLKDVGKLLGEHKITTHVNCGRRGFPGYNTLRQALQNRHGFQMEVTGRGWGLCSNAVHFMDLAEYLFSARITALSGHQLDEGFFSAKRKDCIEVSGKLLGTLTNGGKLTIECQPGSFEPLVIKVSCGDEKWSIDEAKRMIVHTSEAQGQKIEPFEAYNVSEMSHLYVDLLKGRSLLPTYAQSADQHIFLINTLKQHLRISDNESVSCPIS
ncbi:Gfo/Idh/MocA family oxidoreductase [Roseibium sp. FZY0029]|uniref:Gfo/Idh/MocA family oxidoreductase n=1 Tax=Roseibium sp. FZY0029 TaxID=3116647 RepID=UPI002EC22081|nr:Gfo/Idh/MocA family oxidoreductase [Roseibium sp. FZY0029]